ncbi:MAG: substrate-binding domain-containing protein, partial [Novibacillus thermophilus]
RAFKELGKAVPVAVSNIAFSVDPFLSQGIDPPLTAVDLFASKLGSEAVKLLFSIMTKQDEVEQSVIVRAKLNVRKSSAVRK